MKNLKTLIVACALVAAAAVGYAGGNKWPWHPALAKAENQLRNAKQTLEGATHDCGGHRVKAIEHINQAMNEVKEGREYANAHPEEGKK